MRLRQAILAVALALAGAASLAKGAQSVTGSDEWAWLEDVHGAKPLDWVKAQNAKALNRLKADPAYQRDYDQVLAVLDAKDRIPYAALKKGKAYNFWQDADHPKGMWRVTSIADYETASPHWTVLLDVDALAASEHENWVFQGAQTNSEATRALIFLSRGGGDAVVIREYDLIAKRVMPDGFALAQAKGGAGYLNDDTILFETDFGPGSMTKSSYPRIVKAWHRGTPIAAAKTVFEGTVADIGASGSVIHRPDGDIALINRAVSFFEAETYLIGPGLAPVKLPLPLFAQIQDVFAGQIVFTLREDWASGGTHYAKGSLLSFSLDAFRRTGALGPIATLFVPDARSSVQGATAASDGLYVTVLSNVRSTIYKFRDAQGAWSEEKLPLPAGGSAYVAAADVWGKTVQFGYTDYLTPPTLYTSENGEHIRAIKALPARFDAKGLVASQFEATSSDGEKIPYTILHTAAAKGPRPAILYGYGGFEVSLTPAYSANAGMLWLNQGGSYAVANIRGGGEFGPRWHEAALKQNRQKAFDDFAAVAADLITRGFTTAKQLGIVGGSNGGLLVSTVMVQHPERLGAVVCQVPLIDMLAYTHIGAGASWVAEYGDPAIPAERAFIEKYSPYQNVTADVAYPPVFFVTATSDDRVTPVHARKMAARMEAQGHDVLFYENTDGGHSAAANHQQAAEMSALTYVYLRQRLVP